MRRGGIAALGVLAFLATLLLPPLSVAAAERSDEPATLTVRGEGRSRGTPDSATLLVSVRRGAQTGPAARAQADERTRAVLAAILATGLERADVQTSAINLRRDPTSRRTQSRGGVFVASTQITVLTRRVDLVPALLAAATRARADGVDGPNYSLADPSSAAVGATEAALSDARRRAEAAAGALGLRVAGVRSVVLDPPLAEPPLAGSAPSEPDQDRRRPPTEPGQVEVRVTVQVVFELDS